MTNLYDGKNPPTDHNEKRGRHTGNVLRIAVATVLALAGMTGCSESCWERQEVQAAPVFDLRQLQSWTAPDFEKAFGEPHHCGAIRSDIDDLKVCFYRSIGTKLHVPPGCSVGVYESRFLLEVRFRNGQVDYMIIDGEGAKMYQDTLLRYGLIQEQFDRIENHRDPRFTTTIWDDFGGYEYVAVHVEEGYIDRVEANMSGDPTWLTAGYVRYDCEMIQNDLLGIVPGACLDKRSSSSTTERDPNFVNKEVMELIKKLDRQLTESPD